MKKISNYLLAIIAGILLMIIIQESLFIVSIFKQMVVEKKEQPQLNDDGKDE